MKTTIRVYPSRRVVCESRIILPMSARRVWGQLREFHRTAGDDHFHSGIELEGNVPRVGARLTIAHRYGPVAGQRIGRILRWREEVGFAFSDLSQANVCSAFPHVMSMDLINCDGTDSSRLTIRVTGRWTLRSPRWVARIWLGWVMLSISMRLRNRLLMFEAAFRKAERIRRNATVSDESTGAARGD